MVIGRDSWHMPKELIENSLANSSISVVMFVVLIDKVKNQPAFQSAMNVYHKLKAAGYQSFFAGGAVRDLLLGVEPHDFDIATRARPEQVEKLFSQTVAVGKQFGVIVVVDGTQQTEVATFRKDKDYQDGRRPEGVDFCDAEEDALRRDFTINALFWDPDSDEIIDYVGGRQDLKSRQIRAVGEARLRFKEDHLRILRAIRFVAQLDFSIEENTWNAICEVSSLVGSVSRERIRQEIEKLIFGRQAVRALQLCQQAQIFESIFHSSHFRLTDWQKFKPDGQPWYFFWYCLFASGATASEITDWIKSLKASKDWVQKMDKMLFWHFHPDKYGQMGLGHLLDYSFDEDYFFGLIHFINENALQQDKKWNRFLQRSQQLGKARPVPICRANDLMGLFQGEELGKMLRLIYHAQLEGLIQDKKSALDWVQKLR